MHVECGADRNSVSAQALILDRLYKVGWHRIDRLSKHPDRNRGRVALSALKPSDITLRKSRPFSDSLLGQPLALPEPRKIATDDPPHVHANTVGELLDSGYSLY